jgi:hypothetical protein
VAALRAQFHNVPIWFGERTGHYWAMAGSDLVEGHDPADLVVKLGMLTRLEPKIGRTVHAPPPGGGPYGPPQMGAAVRPTPSPAPGRGKSRAAAPSPHRRRRPEKGPRRHRFIGSWLPALT